MNEKQLLKEIAYYSRVINDHKKWNQTTNQTHYKNNYGVCKKPSIPSYDVNKYKYVKAPEPFVKAPVVKNTVTKVLINPNFKGQQVHINPHFKGLNVNAQKIHVNPNIIDTSSINLFQSSTQKKEVANTSSTSSNTYYKSQKSVNLTTTKISAHIKTPVRKRRVSFHSKYKIIKSNSSKARSSPINKSTLVKTRYKLDRRIKENSIKMVTKKKVLLPVFSDTIRNTLFTNRIWRKPVIKSDPHRLNNIIKSKSKNLKIKAEQNNRFRRSLILLRGQKYVMDSSKKTLKLVSSPTQKISTNKTLKRISIRGVTYVQKTPYTYIKVTTTPNSRSLKNKNSKLLTNNKLSKNNVPCPVYHRFGKCRRKEAGRCIFIHNHNQISLCKKFLQGACVDKDCLLSHKVSLEKMPTCKYFLEGCCVRPDCPYLHVKINPNADICRNFLEGFCKEAIKCEKRHQYLCPEFEKYGKCSKRRCLYPHKSKSVKEKIAKEHIVVSVKQKVEAKTEHIPLVEMPRYYEDANIGKKKKDDVNPAATQKHTSEVSEVIQNVDTNCDEIIVRPKLGSLPSYIPFE